MKSEVAIEKAVCDYAKSKGWTVIKFVSPTSNGVPDRLFMWDRHKYFFIEFKTKRGRLSELQKVIISKWQKRNIDVFVVNEIEEGKRIIDDYKKKT